MRRQPLLISLLCLWFGMGAAAQQPTIKHPPHGASVYLLGEIHDNAHGHAQRLALVQQLISQGLRPVVLMEQFDRDNQSVLDRALASCGDADCVLTQAATQGWAWEFYKPYVQWALEKKVTLVAANVSHADVRKVMTQGFSAVFAPQLIAAYKLDSLPEPLQRAQSKAIQEGHCNLLPIHAIGAMVQGQMARDVWMAHLINGLEHPSIVLIAGNGHVRKDAGVYQWLSALKQKITQVHGYVEQATTNDAHWFDQVTVVPEVAREDPCLVFKRPSQAK